MSEPKRFVYILKSINHPTQHYAGLTSDPAVRLRGHNAGLSPHTAAHRLWRYLVAIEALQRNPPFEIRAVPEDRLGSRVRAPPLFGRRRRSPRPRRAMSGDMREHNWFRVGLSSWCPLVAVGARCGWARGRRRLDLQLRRPSRKRLASLDPEGPAQLHEIPAAETKCPESAGFSRRFVGAARQVQSLGVHRSRVGVHGRAFAVDGQSARQ